MDFSTDGLLMCAGTAAGICRVYDLRSSHPLVERDHRNLLPVVDAHFVKKPKHFEGTGGGENRVFRSLFNVCLVCLSVADTCIWRICWEFIAMQNPQLGSTLLAFLLQDLSFFLYRLLSLYAPLFCFCSFAINRH